MKVKTIVKRAVLALLALVGLLVVSGALFVNCSPQFGGAASAAQLARYAKTNHFKDGKFFNLSPFSMKFDCHSISAMLKKMFNPPVGLNPKKNIEVQKLDPKALQGAGDRLVWLGHSSFILRLDGKTILIDPMFSQYAAPIQWFGRPRYNKEMPISIKQIPSVEAVLISHDHYDHLDYDSIVQLAPKTKRFLVPLGVGNHLRRWGVKSEQIHELDWWQEQTPGSIKFALTPSQHMSGRGLTGQSTTLWGSWVIHSSKRKIFFSGDGGYAGHFKKIGKKYGPFDLALLECGQYDKLWSDVHMTPEQTVKAGMDVGARLMMPIHWGAFTLANHPWTEPVKRFTAEASAKKQRYMTPEIGAVVELTPGQPVPTKRWWTAYE